MTIAAPARHNLAAPRRRRPKPTPEPITRDRLAFLEHGRRVPLYNKMVRSTDMDEAWSAYQQLLKDRPDCLEQLIPAKYLHGFAALLVSQNRSMPASKTRTQTTFLRLLSVLLHLARPNYI